MKKRLLIAFAALATAFTGYAHEVDSFVYTPQGRFQITKANECTNSTFITFDGFKSIQADVEVAKVVNYETDGYKEGYNSVSSQAATEGTGIYYEFKPADPGQVYVVSFAMKGPKGTTTRIKTDIKSNLVTITGNSDNVFGGTTNVFEAGAATEVSEEWNTYSFAIVPTLNESEEYIARTYYITFSGMATDVAIADIEIQEAIQVANLKMRDEALNKLNAYKNCYAWEEGQLEGLNEIIGALEGIGDGSTQEELEEALAGVDDVINEFVIENMDDYLYGNNENYLPIGGKLQNSNPTQWTSTTRVYRDDNYFFDLGHFVAGGTWMNGESTRPMGIYMTKHLTPGQYVFSIDSRAAVREGTSSAGAGNWTNNDGLNVAYAVQYIMPNDPEATGDPQPTEDNCVVYKQYDVDPFNFTNGIITADIKEEGDYQFGILVFCKEEFRDRRNGSVTYVRNASFYGKNENAFSQPELVYEANVKTQISTARTNLTNAQERIDNESKVWGKAALQEAINTYTAEVEKYEAMSQDEIISTFDITFYNANKSLTDKDESDQYYRILESEVYLAAAKPLIDANNAFDNQNKVLEDFSAAIKNAEAVLEDPLYSASTERDQLVDAINTAKDTEAAMKATDYSEENASTIAEKTTALTEAINKFKTSIAKDVLAEVDFNATPVKDENGNWSVDGKVGTWDLTADFDEESDANKTNYALLAIGDETFLRVGNSNLGKINIDKEIKTTGEKVDVVTVKFDYFWGHLSGKYAGFCLSDEDRNVIAQFCYEAYNHVIHDVDGISGNTLNINFDKLNSSRNNVGRNGNVNDVADNGNRNTFELVLDYSTRTITPSYVSVKQGSWQGEPQPMPEGVGAFKTFTLKSNYNNASRICVFDNFQVTAMHDVPNGVSNTTTDNKVNANNTLYNVAGQIVNKSYKGLVISKNGKFVQK